MRNLIISLFFLWLPASSGYAQNSSRKAVYTPANQPAIIHTAPASPSMEEAVAYLRDTISPDCTYHFSRCTHFSLTLEGGTTLRYRQEGRTDGGGQGFTESVINLKQLDPTQITKTDMYITVVSKRDTKAISFSADNKATATYPKQDFIVDSIEDLEDARKTILYMIELSQGTPTEQATQDFEEAKTKSLAERSSEQVPRLFDTMDYIVSLLANHGCATHRWHDHWVDSEGNHNENNRSQGCTTAVQPIIIYGCSMVFQIARAGTFYDETAHAKGGFGVDFSSSDPTSIRQLDADLARESFREQDNVDKQELAIGRMVDIRQTDGSSRGPFYIDTEENADHLINALTHAVQLCGGKKAAF